MNQQQREALHRQLDQALDSIAEATRQPGGLERRVEDLARSLNRALMEEAVRSRSQQATEPPAECPECGGTDLRPVRMHTAPPTEGGGEK